MKEPYPTFTTATTTTHQVLISASGDKTLKLWSLKDGACLRTFEGHGAGVLRCRFATAGLQALSVGARPGDKQSTSADHLSQLTCLTTPQPQNPHHASPQTNPKPTPNHPNRPKPPGADGLLKLWSLRTGECAGTFDSHDDRVWALAAGGRHEALLATGGSDARVVIWWVGWGWF
jgi:U3 small nucleolar RNA-associated protein 13